MRLEIGDVAIYITDEQADDLRRQLGVDHPESENLLDTAGVAQVLGVSADYVYRHARDLGGQKLGAGPKSPWRFDPAKLKQGQPERQAVAPKPKPKRRRRQAKGAGLLEVRGESPYAQ